MKERKPLSTLEGSDIGKLTELEKLIDYKKMDEIFICGPEEMIFCVKNFLEQKEIDEKKIHFELFTTSGQKKKSRSQEVKKSNSEADHKVRSL